MALVLGVADYAGPTRWRWLLTDDESGQQLADHQVELNPADDYAAFADLYRYLRLNAVPDRRIESEAEIVARVGAWAGEHVLGRAIGQEIVQAAPVTLRVVVPEQAGFLLGWPLELAHADGKPLAARGDVTVVYDLQRAAGRPADRLTADAYQGEGPVRLLAVFSLPTRTSVLALRRERYELARLIRRIATRDRRRVELTFLQYGVTRQRLAKMADAGDGWDVLHLSGHGGAGTFLLEADDGSPDPVTTTDLVQLLRPLRRRVRLAVMSACESGAATTAETLRWVGLAEQADKLEQQDAQPAENGQADQQEVMTGIARALVSELGCAVLAMRYPVTDDFAIAFTEELYERMLGRQGQALGTAVARSLPVAAGAPSAARPAICLATPVLAGPGAARLVLPSVPGAPQLDPAQVRMERFPSEPERFVGRAQAMARASAILAAGSGRAGILLHGMAGSGKTAAALELAYRHQDSFEAVAFWKAPEHDDEFSSALEDLALALEAQLGDYGFAMADKIVTAEALAAFAPRLRALLEGTGMLLVLDNLETLLTSDGSWRDPRWEPLLTALTSHNGESRVILTSRIPPAQVTDQVMIVPVHALSLEESAALARELPGLRGLLHADSSPLRDSDQTTVARDRDLVRRVLRVVQGHPKLMELADAAASDPTALEAHLNAAEDTAQGGSGRLDAFFRTGVTSLEATQLLETLTAWTSSAMDTLGAPARLMAHVLAFAEDDDRSSLIVEMNWADIWRRLQLPGEPPDHRPLLESLTTMALIQAEALSQSRSREELPTVYRIHPGVNQAIRASADAGIQEAIDWELAAFWITTGQQALGQGSGETGQVVVHSGLHAAPYLIRLKAWGTAATVLQSALNRASSPATGAVIASFLRTIADSSGDPLYQRLLGRALSQVTPAQAEEVLRESLARALSAETWQTASAAMNDLINLLRDAGRLREALDLADEKQAISERAGYGSWTQLADQGRRLQILGLMGEHEQVLDQVATLLDQMAQLPDKADEGGDGALPWNVREATLDVGRSSAMALRRWQQCLDLNAAILASLRARGVDDYDIAYARFNDSGPLRQLGRLDEADQLLAQCQQVFLDHDDIIRLARTFTARANVQHERGNYAGALALARTAIRYAYIRPEPRDIALDHASLANRLADSDPVGRRAHGLAAALIHALIGMAHEVRNNLTALAMEKTANRNPGLPSALDEIIAVAEQTEGVRLGNFLTALQPDREAVENLLAQILAAVPAVREGEIKRYLQQWETGITRAVAAANGDQQGLADLNTFLDQASQVEGWTALIAVLRRIAAGERSTGMLDDLDPVSSAVVREVLTRLGESG